MEPTLSAYNPTWRDRLASWMMGQGQASPERRQFVGGLLGSTGLGNNGVGVVDATPVGGLLGLQEAAKAGDRTGMALAAAGMVPGAGVAEKVAAKAAERVAPAAERFITAYHGSPHSFDKFDLSKIGTGEGAQAYGHGLYFADNEGVARTYRDVLSKKAGLTRAPMIDGMEAHKFSNTAALNGADDEAEAARLYWDFVKRQPPGSRHSYDALNSGETSNNDIFGAFVDNLRSQREQAGSDYSEYYDNVLQGANKITNKIVEQPLAGAMYQVRINADPEHFLDWDKPIIDQKHIDTIANAIDDKDIRETFYRNAMGKNPISGGNAYLNYVGKNAADSAAKLKELGIPGIKYLDQGSRDAGTGSRNYVVFDDSLIDILKKYGLVGLLGGGAAMGAGQQQQTGVPTL